MVGDSSSLSASFSGASSCGGTSFCRGTSSCGETAVAKRRERGEGGSQGSFLSIHTHEEAPVLLWLLHPRSLYQPLLWGLLFEANSKTFLLLPAKKICTNGYLLLQQKINNFNWFFTHVVDRFIKINSQCHVIFSCHGNKTSLTDLQRRGWVSVQVKSAWIWALWLVGGWTGKWPVLRLTL